MTDLKDYFKQSYQGQQSFLDNVIFPIFGTDCFESGYNQEVLALYPELQTVAQATGIASVLNVGTIDVDFNPISIFDITVKNRTQLNRNRVGIQQIIRRIMSTYSSAFMIFHYDDAAVWDWRFSFCSKATNDALTDSKRYTFLLGPNQSCRTVADNFGKLLGKAGDIELDDIKAAFDVEALSDEFFGKYKQHYERFVEYVTGKRFVKTGGKWLEQAAHEPHPQMYADFGRDDKRVRDYVKKLLGRIVFLHFLQKKGWLGVPAGKAWGEGDQNFMLRLFECATEAQQEDFLDTVLEPLFAKGLDADRAADDYLFDTQVALPQGSKVKVPYLNGGLFERDALDEIPTKFPSQFFADLLNFLYQYNFTIDENDPDDAQVGVDPEMLGRIFENLLEDNKDKGAFYTPKEIVRYMCRQSLTAYLCTGISNEGEQQAIGEYVKTYDVAHLGGASSPLAQFVDERLKEVKICDPAIGSGAFPMGMLKELFLCRGAIENFDNAAAIKRHIICNNIYGVDIERGAVDIARLRFWLSLVVDEDEPHTLPNLDFKVMQGNSLLEQYQGADLSCVAKDNVQQLSEGRSLVLFDSMLDVYRKELRTMIVLYYSEDNHAKKQSLLTRIKENVSLQLQESGINVDLSHIDLQANPHFFLWHTWFGDVLNRPDGKGGFDIVIGNPPYIQLQDNGGSLAKLYERGGYETFARTGDIYCLFYERGWQLLKQGGHLCFITSNKWMRAGYGEKTRAFFAQKTNPMLLLDFAGLKIFESATVDTNILLFSKSENKHKTISVVAGKQNKNSLSNLSDFVMRQHSVCDFSTSESWVILSPIEQSIKRKIEAVGTPLKDWDIQINYGIKTGCNEAFIITTEKRNEILANCQTEEERARTEELIRPVLRGRDIKRYGYEWADLWLIATFPSRHYDIEEYPAIKTYLLSFGIERLEQTGKKYVINGEEVKARKKTNNKWFETQDSINYWQDFFQQKVIYMEIQTDNEKDGYPFPCFSYDVGNNIVLNTAYILSSNSIDVRFVLGFINSKIGRFLTKMYVTQLQERQYRMLAQYVSKFPIPQLKGNQTNYIIELVNENMNNQNKEIEERIDRAVCSWYNLDANELDYINNEGFL